MHTESGKTNAKREKINENNKILEIKGFDLSFDDIAKVVSYKMKVSLTSDPEIIHKVYATENLIQELVNKGEIIYGVTTNFGGLANTLISVAETEELQSNQIWGLKCGIGKEIDDKHVLVSMLLRANALMKGVSGIRLEIIERFCKFINNDVIPIVYEHGSIGASGDLVPLAHIAGAIIGLSNDFRVKLKGTNMGAIEALEKLKLSPITLQAKEGLALVNGTSVSTAIAINTLTAVKDLFNLALHLHAILIISLQGHVEAFHEFVQQNKPHPGQIAVAKIMRNLLLENDQPIVFKNTEQQGLIQDRYSIRCLPQFLGVIHEGLQKIENTLIIEANSANDNPLLDYRSGKAFHAGNFLGQHVAVCMDELRHYIALLAKHLDAQISLLVSPEFNKGLPGSLEGKKGGNIKYGLKGLQISMNSLMSMLIYYGNHFSHLFSTHCEQFNQNINSLSYGAANLTWEASQILQNYLAMATIVAIQGIELRTYTEFKTYDARKLLPSNLKLLYENVYHITNKSIDPEKPIVLNYHESPLDTLARNISKNIYYLVKK